MCFIYFLCNQYALNYSNGFFDCLTIKNLNPANKLPTTNNPASNPTNISIIDFNVPM